MDRRTCTREESCASCEEQIWSLANSHPGDIPPRSNRQNTVQMTPSCNKLENVAAIEWEPIKEGLFHLKLKAKLGSSEECSSSFVSSVSSSTSDDLRRNFECSRSPHHRSTRQNIIRRN
ncbi:hypothetical protein RJ641_022795 [Dillenia turbinata]|uniref:Uncharacterized protein n=1 Tax=Dillenia turbinata TaxID=194707 RepID=A0AAN8UFT4_9MAGN